MCKSGSAVVTGQKLCPHCRTFDPNTVGEEVVTDVETPESPAHDSFDVEYEMESAKESLNSSLLKLDISPLKNSFSDKSFKISSWQTQISSG